MSYERLQITDHVDKWSVNKVRHIEDGIIANEEVIRMLQGGSQADWGQNDESAVDYIKNRTHSVVVNEKIVTNKKVVTYSGKDGQRYADWDDGFPIYEFEMDPNISNWFLLINGIELSLERMNYLEEGPSGPTCTWYFNKSDRIYWGNTKWSLTTQNYDEGVELDIMLIYRISNYKTLNENYIPETIARKNDVVTSINNQKGDVNFTWDTVGSVQEGFDTVADWQTYDVQCKLVIGNIVYFDIEDKDYFGDVRNFYTIKWIVDETYSFSSEYLIAHYTNGILTVSPKDLGGYNYVRAYASNTYNIIDEKYLPKAEAIANITEAPTAEDFNNLLQVLRDAGYLATE